MTEPQLDAAEKVIDPSQLTEKDLEFNHDLMKEDINETGVIKSVKEILDAPNIPDAEIHTFMELVTRIKSKEKINNIFAELPPTFKRQVLKTMGETNEEEVLTSNPTICNFLAKELIQDIVGNTAFDSLISEYNKEMATVNSDLKNGKTLVSAYNDVMRETMTVKYLEIAKELREKGNEETAVYYEKLSESYSDAYSFKRIKDAIEAKPSLINRAYKESKHYESYAYDFSMKYCMNIKTIKNAEGKDISMPSIRTLDSACKALQRSGVLLNEDFAKALCVLIYLVYADVDITNIHEYTHLYFLIDSIYVLDKASNSGYAIEETINNISAIEKKFEELLADKASIKYNKKKKH